MTKNLSAAAAALAAKLRRTLQRAAIEGHPELAELRYLARRLERLSIKMDENPVFTASKERRAASECAATLLATVRTIDPKRFGVSVEPVAPAPFDGQEDNGNEEDPA